MNGELMAKEAPRLIVHTEPNPLAGTPAYMLQLAVEQGADLAKLEKLMELQERWEKNEARKAFVAALSAFKANPPDIVKNKHVKIQHKNGPGFTEYDHATLDHVSAEIGKALAQQQMSHRWDVEQKEGGIIQVTCVLQHVMGHSERVTMQSLADQSGSKNSIQAIGSTVTYLQRYTLLAATGVAVKGQDNDGACEPEEEPLVSPVQAKMLQAVLNKCSPNAQENFTKMHGSVNEITRAEFDEVLAKLENSAKRTAQGNQK